MGVISDPYGRSLQIEVCERQTSVLVRGGGIHLVVADAFYDAE